VVRPQHVVKRQPHGHLAREIAHEATETGGVAGPAEVFHHVALETRVAHQRGVVHELTGHPVVHVGVDDHHLPTLRRHDPDGLHVLRDIAHFIVAVGEIPHELRQNAVVGAAGAQRADCVLHGSRGTDVPIVEAGLNRDGLRDPHVVFRPIEDEAGATRHPVAQGPRDPGAHVGDNEAPVHDHPGLAAPLVQIPQALQLLLDRAEAHDHAPGQLAGSGSPHLVLGLIGETVRDAEGRSSEFHVRTHPAPLLYEGAPIG